MAIVSLTPNYYELLPQDAKDRADWIAFFLKTMCNLSSDSSAAHKCALCNTRCPFSNANIVDMWILLIFILKVLSFYEIPKWVNNESRIFGSKHAVRALIDNECTLNQSTSRLWEPNAPTLQRNFYSSYTE